MQQRNTEYSNLPLPYYNRYAYAYHRFPQHQHDMFVTGPLSKHHPACV